jgi:Ca-activated chloride channel family protein
MQLANLDYLWLLLIVPAGVLLGLLRKRGKERLLSAFADEALVAALVPAPQEISRTAKRYTWMLTLVLFFLVAALLRPQWGFSWKESKRRGSDIVLAVDVSQSMLAADVPPSRLERARRKILDLLSQLHGDRIALVSFAGAAFIETPLTLDYRAFRMFLDLLDTSLVPLQGSNVELALDKSLKALGVDEQHQATGSKRGSAIILFTDGEELDGDVGKEIARAKATGVKVFVLGLGTPEGAPISTANGYKKDKAGRVVITKLKPEILEKIALETGGTYIQSVSSDRDLDLLYRQGIKRALSESDMKIGNEKRWHEYYQYPLFFALLLLVFGPWGELLSRLVRRRDANAVSPLSRVVPTHLEVLLLFFLFAAPPQAVAESPERLGEKAKRAFETGNFQESLQHFEQGEAGAADDFRFDMGRGANYYRMNKFDQAQAVFTEAARKAKEKNDKAAAYYNAANSLVQQQQYKDAIATYKQSLELNPEDQEAKDNLAYAKRLLELQKQQQKQQQQNKENNQNDNKDKKEDRNEQQNSDQKQNNSEQDNSKQEHQPQDQQTGSQDSKGQQNNQDDQTSNQQQPKDGTDKDKQAEPTPTASPTPQGGGEQGAAQEQPDDSNKEQQKGQQETQPQPTPGPSPQASPQGGGQSAQQPENQQQQNSAGGDSTEDGGQDDKELDSLLRSVQEKESSRKQYRMEKAIRELKQLKQKLPERDW